MNAARRVFPCRERPDRAASGQGAEAARVRGWQPRRLAPARGVRPLPLAGASGRNPVHAA